MKINVFSLSKAKEEVLSGNNKNWISIWDYGFDDLYEPFNKVDNKLVLVFDDVIEYHVKHNLMHPFYQREILKRDLILFNEGFAKQIKEFADKVYAAWGSLNIHCYAGKSRSQAVADVLNVYYNLYVEVSKEDYLSNLKQFNDSYSGNPDVARILKKILYFG